MVVLRALLAATLVAGTMLMPALAQEQTATELCNERVGKGIEFADIEPIGAIEACLDASKADPDNTDLRYSLARAYDAAEDYEKAHIHYTAAVNGGSLMAQAALGQLYEFGLGVEIDYERAAELYEPAMEAGVRIAIEGMAKLHETGNGVEQDYVRAAELYKQASDAGSNWSTAMLGWLTENGFGVIEDDVEALRLYRIAAAAGIDFAQNNIGVFYDQGIADLEEDDAEAVRYFTMAADQGMVLAYLNLAPHYADGDGVKKNLVKAEEYFRKAMAEGDAAQVAQASNNLAWMFATENIKLDEAEQLAREAMAADPEQSDFVDTMAWILHKTGRNEEALPLIKRAIEMDPTDADFTDHLEAIEAALAE